MKRVYLFLFFISVFLRVQAQLITIAEARASAEGTTVTVRGIVVNGSELGPIRYMQDETGAIAAYDFAATADVVTGDSIEVTGVLDNYNSLLEISPVTSLTILSSGNPVPAPLPVTLTDGWVEEMEGYLVEVSGVHFTETGTFSTAGSGTNYDVTDGISSAQVRIQTSTNIDGTVIPEEDLFITGIMSQYAPGGSGGYQLLPRDLTDISTGGNPPVISSGLSQTNITTTGFTVGFETLYNGNTIIYYGTSAGALTSTSEDAAMTTSHTLGLAGLTPATIYYVQAASVSASNDTSWSAVAAMATSSNSSGEIRVWFNNPVDNSVSTGVNAMYDTHFADTIISYIDNAVYSIDMALYNIDNINNIVTALNDAYVRGVTVRVICDAGVNSAAYDLLSIGAGNKKKSPTGMTPDGDYYGIMHNKFLVIDVVSTDADQPWVIGGSTNFTDEQLKIDKQNMIAIQDHTLAKAYRAEFEEMWSGSFGPEKTNNTPHDFIIDGKHIELYFSPSDNTESHILSSIQSADHDLYFGVFSYTRYGISYEIQDAIDRGVFAAGIWDQTDPDDPTAIEVLESAMGSTLFEASGSPLFHHKYLIVDPNCPQSDPLVLTGSHNWTSSANSRNDENTLIIHDSTIANIYYQEFSQRYQDEGGTEVVGDVCDYVAVDAVQAVPLQVYPNPANNWIVLESDQEGKVSIFDLSGNMLNTFQITEGTNTIPVIALQTGMYVMLLQTESAVFTGMISIQH